MAGWLAHNTDLDSTTMVLLSAFGCNTVHSASLQQHPSTLHNMQACWDL